ncbi:MAG: hypothetical protein R3Y63_15675, partial [Eubacteriales bacterium]
AERAKNAEFDEQLALITLLIEALTKGMREVSRMDKWGIAFGKESMMLRSGKSVEEIAKHLQKLEEDLAKKRHANSISKEEIYLNQKVIGCFEEMMAHFSQEKGNVDVVNYSKKFYLDHKKIQKKDLVKVQSEITNTLNFAKEAFGDSQSFFLVLTELTTDPICAEFLSKHGGEAYYQHNKTLLIHDNQKELLEEIEDLEELWEKLEEEK